MPRVHGYAPQIVLIGDSRIRQLRDGVVKQMTGVDRDWLSNKSIQFDRHTYRKHESSSHSLGKSGLNLRYIWSGTLGEKAIDRYLEKVDVFRQTHKTPKAALIHVAGFGVWTMEDCQKKNVSLSECLNRYER